MILTIDGCKIENVNILHECISHQLNFPSYYGNNLDALWDILSVWSEILEIKLLNTEKLMEYLGEYALETIELLNELSNENKNIVFEQN